MRDLRCPTEKGAAYATFQERVRVGGEAMDGGACKVPSAHPSTVHESTATAFLSGVVIYLPRSRRCGWRRKVPQDNERPEIAQPKSLRYVPEMEYRSASASFP